ncbi:hypothetical protein D3C75_930740 [compost metagenome]
MYGKRVVEGHAARRGIHDLAIEPDPLGADQVNAQYILVMGVLGKAGRPGLDPGRFDQAAGLQVFGDQGHGHSIQRSTLR